jgi:hypothetical protein
MIRDDIIRMARVAGFAVNEKARQHQPNCIFHTQYMVDELLERFAALVAAAEREACAKMVEGLFDDPNDSVLAFIVDAIRARGQA